MVGRKCGVLQQKDHKSYAHFWQLAIATPIVHLAYNEKPNWEDLRIAKMKLCTMLT